MTRITVLIAALSITILSAIPSMAQDEPLRLEPCETSNPVLTVDGLEESLAMPVLSGDNITAYTLDLSGQDTEEGVDHDTSAKVYANLAWDVVVNDYDLQLGSQTTEGYQPLDPATEFAQATIAHCAVVTIGAVNFLATGGDSVNLAVSVSPR